MQQLRQRLRLRFRRREKQLLSSGERGRLLLRSREGVLGVAGLRLLLQAIGCGLHAVREERRSDAHEEESRRRR